MSPLASPETTLPVLGNNPQTSPIRLGLLGLNFGESIARKITETVDCLKMVAVCELDQIKLKRVAKSLKVKAYDQLDAMLADPEIEAIGVFTGSAGRAKLISKILQNGKHVLTTKPFELEVKEAEKVLHEARERGLVVHLNSPGPHPAQDVATIRHWIGKHDLGMPVAFHARTWANYREKPSGSWYDDPEKCAAAPILRLGVYFLNEFAHFMGKPRSVHVVQSRLFTERPTSDHAHMTIKFESGAIGSVFASFCIDDGRPWRDEINLNFERGTINRWVERLCETDMSSDFAITELQQKGAETFRMQTEPGAFAGWYQWQAFQTAIRREEGMSQTYVDSIVYGVRLLDAMRKSAVSGQSVLV